MIYAIIQTDKNFDELNAALESIGIAALSGNYAADKSMVYAVNIREPFKTDADEFEAQELIDALETKGFNVDDLCEQICEVERLKKTNGSAPAETPN